MLKEGQSANGTRWAEASRRALLQASPRRGPLSLISVSVIPEKPKATTHGHAAPHPVPPKSQTSSWSARATLVGLRTEGQGLGQRWVPSMSEHGLGASEPMRPRR